MERLRLHEGDGVLLVRLGAVGDVVRTLPCLARLREANPGLRLGWAVEAPSAPLLPGPPWLDQLFVFPRRDLGGDALLRRPGATLRSLTRFISKLRAFGPAVAVDFQGTLKSSLVAFCSGARVRLGFDRTGSREGSFLLSNLHVRPSSPRLNRVLKNLELVAPLARAELPLRFPFPVRSSSARIRAFVSSLGGRLRIVIHPGTSSRQRHKRWPEKSYARLLAMLAEVREIVPILTWGPGEESLVRRILDLSGGAAIAAPPTDLAELRELIACSHLFVGSDTGPMHLAWSQGIPVVAIFGATDPLVNGPLGDASRVVAPAWDGSAPFPPRGDREAIRGVEPGLVLETIRDLLAAGGRLPSTALRT